jgi:hypothetical protein
MLERKRGKCAAAETLWSAAIKDLKWDEAGQAEWHARANMGLALCKLGAGAPAIDFVNRAWVHGNQDQLRLAMAVAIYEQGESQTAHALFLVAGRLSDPAVQSGLKAWYAGTGLTP